MAKSTYNSWTKHGLFVIFGSLFDPGNGLHDRERTENVFRPTFQILNRFSIMSMACKKRQQRPVFRDSEIGTVRDRVMEQDTRYPGVYADSGRHDDPY